MRSFWTRLDLGDLIFLELILNGRFVNHGEITVEKNGRTDNKKTLTQKNNNSPTVLQLFPSSLGATALYAITNRV